MKKVLIKNVQCSFPSVYTPNTAFGPDGKRELTLLLNKGTHSLIIGEINNFISHSYAKMDISNMSTSPLRDGDKEDRPEYAEHMVIKASNRNQFPVVDSRKKPINQTTQSITSGDYVNAVITLHPYKEHGIVWARLEAVQFIKQGNFEVDPLSDFGVFNSECDDPF